MIAKALSNYFDILTQMTLPSSLNLDLYYPPTDVAVEENGFSPMNNRHLEFLELHRPNQRATMLSDRRSDFPEFCVGL